jgi:hypothetical protein
MGILNLSANSMKLIEKIEITHFRSFLGTPNKFGTQAGNLRDLNIFSGSNDSGKSNILRVLNLFFNDEISSGVPFEFERDFFLGKKEAPHRVVEIRVSFDLSHDGKRDRFLPEKFKISKFYNRNGFRNYVYSFELKEKSIEVKVDSRSDKNDHIAKMFLDKDSSQQEKEAAAKREWVYRVKFSGFLNKSISYIYVPAIRDKHFFAQLFGRVFAQIKRNEDEKINQLRIEKVKIQNYQKTRKNKSERKDLLKLLANKTSREARLKVIDVGLKQEGRLSAIMSKLEEEINIYSQRLISSINFLSSEFRIGKNLQEFFEGFDVGTGSEKSISLSLRGDGVQAKFVPKILNFLSQIESEKKYFIWGFEEPENSAEYKNQQELANEFKSNFSTTKQIFLTTHSEEFLQLYDGADIKTNDRVANLYHVRKLSDVDYGDYSQIFPFDVERKDFKFSEYGSDLESDLGLSYLRAKYSKEINDLQEGFLKERNSIHQENLKLNEQLKKVQKPIVFVEDTYDRLYKIAWLKLNNHIFDTNNLETVFDSKCPFVIHKCEGASHLAGFLRMRNLDFWNDKKVIGLFDFDEEGVKQFKNLKNESYWNVSVSGTKKEGIYKLRKAHQCFCALLTPIPDRLSGLADLGYPSFVEIENLLSETSLKENSIAVEQVTTGNTKYLKVTDSKKPSVGKIAIGLDRSHFLDFEPLFAAINKLFNE